MCAEQVRDDCQQVSGAGDRAFFNHGVVPSCPSSGVGGERSVTGQRPRSPDASMSVKRVETGAGADQVVLPVAGRLR